jgi:hypothetical protein
MVRSEVCHSSTKTKWKHSRVETDVIRLDLNLGSMEKRMKKNKAHITPDRFI